MTGIAPQAIPLIKAYFCLSCEHIVNDYKQCTNCTAGTLYPLASWLDRPEKENGLLTQKTEEDISCLYGSQC